MTRIVFGRILLRIIIHRDYDKDHVYENQDNVLKTFCLIIGCTH